MDREVLFEEFLKECQNREQWSGQGNPNADILIIGKEPHEKNLVIDKEEVKRRLLKQEIICREGFGEAPRDPQNPTWCNYQLLIENVYGPEVKFNPRLFDFEKYAFTTELNTVFRPKAVLDAETKKNINERLIFFKDSKFINSFPVIILACNNFISNDEKRGYLINNTFGVKFDGESKGVHKEEPRGHWFYTHHSDNGEKLVIHTRQLSFLFNTDNFLMQIADEIKDHLRKLRLI